MSQGPPYCWVKAIGTVPECDTNPYNLICLPVNGSDWNVRQVIIKCTFFAILTQGVSLFLLPWILISWGLVAIILTGFCTKIILSLSVTNVTLCEQYIMLCEPGHIRVSNCYKPCKPEEVSLRQHTSFWTSKTVIGKMDWHKDIDCSFSQCLAARSELAQR